MTLFFTSSSQNNPVDRTVDDVDCGEIHYMAAMYSAQYFLRFKIKNSLNADFFTLIPRAFCVAVILTQHNICINEKQLLLKLNYRGPVTKLMYSAYDMTTFATESLLLLIELSQTKAHC